MNLPIMLHLGRVVTVFRGVWGLFICIVAPPHSVSVTLPICIVFFNSSFDFHSFILLFGLYARAFWLPKNE